MNISKQIAKANSLKMDQKEEWVVVRRAMNISIEEMENAKPEVLICISPDKDIAIGMHIISSVVPDSEIQSWALKCMTSPKDGKPRRPSKIMLNGPGLDSLQLILRQLDIQVSVSFTPHPVVEEVISIFENSMDSKNIPPYLMHTNLNKETVAEYFNAAAEYYRVKPWELFECEETIKIEIRRKKKVYYWAIVMGTVGQEFGLGIYRSYDELSDILDSVDDTEAYNVGKSLWMMGFSYENIADIGPVAQAECFENGWFIANESAYPSAIVNDPHDKEHVRLPKKKELTDLTIVTRAVAEFMDAHRKEVKENEDVEDVIEVEVLGEKIPVSLMLPAPESVDEFEDDEDDFEDDEDVLPNPFKELIAKLSAELDRAQEYADMAWEEDSKSKRIKLAKQALAMSEYCVDAYLLLAEDSARDADEKLKLLLQAVQAGRNVIGERDFASLVGDFWLVAKTRPYMRAILKLAEFYAEQDDHTHAIEVYEDMLMLNKSDNLGVRYPLSSCLLTVGRDNDVRQLLTDFKSDKTAFWLYTKAFVSYRQKPDSKTANADLAKALFANELVPNYLLERKRFPVFCSTDFVIGSDEEAVLYADLNLDSWRSTEGAIEWLRNAVDSGQTKLPGI